MIDASRKNDVLKKLKKEVFENTECDIGVGVPGRYGVKIGIEKYNGDTTVTINVGVCIERGVVRKGTMKGGFSGRRMYWVGGNGKEIINEQKKEREY